MLLFLGFKTPGFMLSRLHRENPIPVSLYGRLRAGFKKPQLACVSYI
jgi:hypothetical protein